MSSHLVTLRHNFETAHRLPQLGGKCVNLHGHSWQVEVTVAAEFLTEQQTVIEFGAFKREMRAWIDTHLDHGTMLGQGDPLVDMLESLGSKVFVFGRDWTGATWPTVEAVALCLADQAFEWISDLTTGMAIGCAAGVEVARVRVTETATNGAEWVAA